MVYLLAVCVVGLVAALAVLLWRYGRAAGSRHAAPGNRRGGTTDGRAPQDDRLEELGKLTGGLAHEIKNPLSTIKVNLKLVTEDLETLAKADADHGDPQTAARLLARAARKITVIQKETERLEQILEGFLRYVTHTRLSTASVDINTLVGDVIDFYLPQAHSHSVTIRHRFHDGPLVCRVDENMIKQVLLNLFINATQAMSGGGELIVTTDRRRGEAVITVTDTGCGIEPDKLEKVFDAYYCLRPGGTGLGLATAKRIIEAHNGRITVRSNVGKGTSFTITLPAQT